jgi:anti-sigma factor RsiW
MKAHLEELLSGYVDDQLTVDERARAEKHLGECAACRAELEALRELKETMREVQVAHTMEVSPEFFWSQVKRRIEEEERRDAAAASRGGGAWWGELLWRRLAFAGVAALVVVAIGVALFGGKTPLPSNGSVAFAEVDSVGTKVQGGEVQLANLGDHAIIVMPESFVEVDSVRTNVPNASVITYESPDTGDTVIQMMGFQWDDEDLRGM